jgi:thioredoxin reductase (NADPH)
VVIGGGSGGLAASKEAARFGAKVAVLDFVKPSPQGSTWGLGGTCVNVGCIPKKLMHHASTLGEAAGHAVEYGWKTPEGSSAPSHDWETLRDNVQDHIKGLNFGYKVQLRDEGVKYINKLGSFVSPNELQVVDKKGKAETITAARFIIATGGRPTLPDCEGSEHVITSDDLFMLPQAPGKTCVLGAGYVALECAGFINGLKGGEVTVLVRSIPLRGFDRDIVEKVISYMENAGTKIITGVTPTKIVKIPAGTNGSERDQFNVTYSNGDSGVYDTVMCAIGRRADTHKLNIESLGVKVNPSNGKIIATNEQTSVPNVYAIGDVVDKTPGMSRNNVS